jgi:casein kinase II subunit alpha
MHRDIKPFNVLINPDTKAVKIIDFGLAEFYFPEKSNNTNVASLYYKSPELFFSNSHYDYRVDIWSAGLVLAGMVTFLLSQIFNKTPFLHGTDNIDQILKITKLVGTREVVKYIKENKLTEKSGHKKENICFDLLIAFENGDIKEEKPSDLSEFINEGNKGKATW